MFNYTQINFMIIKAHLIDISFQSLYKEYPINKFFFTLKTLLTLIISLKIVTVISDVHLKIFFIVVKIT